jgi:hypothetical protein
MRVRIWLVAALAIIAAGTSTLAFSVEGQPKIVFEQPNFAFGNVIQGKKVEHVFTFTNRGDAPLIIERIRSSCGCTVAENSTRQIAPGKKGEIKATFDSTNFAATVTKTLYVHTNDPQTPVATLTLTGTITEQIVVTPRQLNFGGVRSGSIREAVVTIENKGDTTLTIKSVRPSGMQITTTVRNEVIKPKETGSLLVQLSPNPTDRAISGYLLITTDHPVKRDIIVNYFGNIVP